MKEQYIHCLEEMLKWSKGLEYDGIYHFNDKHGICDNLRTNLFTLYNKECSNINDMFTTFFLRKYGKTIFPIPGYFTNLYRLWKEEQLEARQKLIGELIQLLRKNP